MTDYPVLEFVDRIARDADVRLTLSDSDPFALPRDDGFTLGMPGYSGSPDSVGVGYGYRELTVPLKVYADSTQARDRWSALAREVARPWNILRWQLDRDSEPVYFRTYRSEPGSVDYSRVWTDGATPFWRVDQTLIADPWAYGHPVTGGATVTHDPIDVTGMFVRLGDVKGDLPAPLQISTSAFDVRGRRLMVVSQALRSTTQTGVVQRQTPGGMTVYSGGTAGGAPGWAGTSPTTVGDSAMSDTSYIRFTPAAGDVFVWKSILSTTVPVAVGEWRLLLRVRASDTAAIWKFRAAQLDATTSAYALRTGPVVDYTPRTTVGPHWLDLGVFRFPYGAPRPVQGLTTPATAPSGILAVQLYAGQTGVTTDVDVALFVPAGQDDAVDTRTSWTAFDKSLPASTYKVMLDGNSGDRYLLDTSDAYSTGLAPVAEGALPMVVPGADNSLHWIRHVGLGYNDSRTGVTTGTNSSLTGGMTVNWSYFPRYTWERPSGG